jgi:hypothetical protein
MVSSIRSLSRLAIANYDQRIVIMGVEEGVDLGSEIKDYLLLNLVL